MTYPSAPGGYGQPVKRNVDTLQAEVDYLQVEVAARERMIAFILKQVGPVHLTKATLDEGVEEGLGILIEEDEDGQGFNFSLGQAPE